MAAPIVRKISRCTSFSTNINKLASSQHIFRMLRNFTVQSELNPRTSESSESKAKFHLFGSLILERKPLITAQKSPEARKYQQLLDQIELEKSNLSEHERRHQRDIELVQLRLQDDFVENPSDVSLLTAVDMEDLWTDEKNKFQPADKITEADMSGETNTTQRKLDRCLYLLVKQSFGSGQPYWVFPQRLWAPGLGALSEVSSSVMEELTEDEVSIQLLGHTPFAYYRKMYPAGHRSNAVGAKVFFHKAVIASTGELRSLRQGKDYLDFGWLTSEEIQTKVEKPYWSVVKNILHYC